MNQNCEKRLENLPDNRPDFIKNNEVGSNSFYYQNKKIKYSILKKELEKNLPGFLGYHEGHLFISEEVPEKYRKPQLIHELIEFTKFKNKKGKCQTALAQELLIAKKEFSQEEYSEYVAYRTIFFLNLNKYYQSSSDKNFKWEIKNSLNFLELINM